MRRSPVPTIGLVLGVALLVDLLRVWLPSIITIFGQAAATPAELLAAFALVWFLLAFAAPRLIRLAGGTPVALAAAVVLAGCRLALPATGGGSAQLYLASFGLLAALVWLAASAASIPRPIPGLVLGLAAATATHAALATHDLVWRPGVGTWTLTVLVALAFVAATGRPAIGRRAAGRLGIGRRATGRPTAEHPANARPGVADPAPDVGAPTGGARSWLVFGPALLLSGMVAGSPALLQTGLSYGSGLGLLPGSERLGSGIAQSGSSDALGGLLLGTTALTVFVAGGLLTGRRRPSRWAGGLLLLAGTVAFASTGPDSPLPAAMLVPAVLATAAGLGMCLGANDRPADNATTTAARRAARRGYAALAGMTVFAVAAIAYYAAYDLGYPNGWVPVGIAALLAASAVSGRPDPVQPDSVPDASRCSARRRLVAATAFVAALAGTAAPQTAPDALPRTGASEPAPANGQVRLVAYNIRMGFGLDGRFDLAGLAEVIAGQDPDVVALSEVDRAWLLNGGHDTLALLARRLDMSYVFAPAADAVWGDAVLTRFAVREARTVALPAVGAPTGAQALAVTLDVGGRDLVVVSTHLQPPPDAGPVVQARVAARFATEFAAGRPLVVAGDLNTEPGEPAFEALRDAGLVDALATARPLPTSPADDPSEEIDHVLVSPGVTAVGVVAPASTASDHLPVAATLILPPADPVDR